MPGKSRRKGKYSVQNKKQGVPAQAKAVVSPSSPAQVHQATTTSSPQASPRVGSTPPRAIPSSSARGGVPLTKASSIRTEFVGIELRNIGILAALMLILLFVLARFIA